MRTDREGSAKPLHFAKIDTPVVRELDAIAAALRVSRAVALELMVAHQEKGENGLPLWVQAIVETTQLPMKAAA